MIVDLPGFRGILDTATRLGTVTPAGRKPLWVTEFDWWTNPPNRLLGKPVATVARWTTLSLYKAWQAGAETLIWYRLRDHRFWPGGLWFSSADPSKVETAADLTTATLDADKPKSALANFRWPMLVSTGRRPFAWGIVPCRVEDVVVTVQKSVNRRWVNVATAISSPSGTFVVGLPTAGSGVGVWRAVVPEDCVAQSSSQAASPAWNTQG